ncbi:phosphotransferase family protein [Mycolicibacterium phlei]
MPTIPASITADWLSQALGADVRVRDVEQIGIGVGLLGRLFRVHLDGGSGVPPTVVVKLPTLDATARSAICETGELYAREVRFYREVGLRNPLPPARPYLATFDPDTHDFVLVLEDLARLRTADQTVGCTVADAEIVIDAIAAHHAHWWNNDRLAALTWLAPLNVSPLYDIVTTNYKSAWPRFLELLGADLSPAMRDFGERLASSSRWFADQFSRPPLTFTHGDLRLDQMFFGVSPHDPPLTALDWQLSAKGRGAYDLGYFLSQSMTADTRRRCEGALLDRYAARLADHGICYPRDELAYDYRVAVSWCFVYPVIGVGKIEITNDRHLRLMRRMLAGAVAAIEDHDGFSLTPD